MNHTTDAALDATSVARNAAEVLLSGGVINGLNLEGCASHLARNVIDWSLAIEKLTAAYEMAEADCTALRAQVAAVTAQFVISEKDRERLLYLVAEERRNVLLANIARETTAYARGVHDAADLLDSMRRDPQYAGEGCDSIIAAIRALADAPPAPVARVKPDAAIILAKEMQMIVAADRWKGRPLTSTPPEKWSHLRPETQQFWTDTAARILAALLPQAGQ